MTNAFDKAIAIIEEQARAHGGEYPEGIDLAKYPSAEIFAQHHPGENYQDHLTQQRQLMEWCKAKGIRIHLRRVQPDWPHTAMGKAQAAVRKPYKLGLELGNGSVSHFAVMLKHHGHGGER